VLAAWDGRAQAVLVVADQLKPGAPAAVAALRGLGLRPVLLTGDNERAARQIADALGIAAHDTFAGVRPEEKGAVLRDLQVSAGPLAFAGDGVNDAAALAVTTYALPGLLAKRGEPRGELIRAGENARAGR
jgi:Cu+-exporting ATPase